VLCRLFLTLCLELSGATEQFNMDPVVEKSIQERLAAMEEARDNISAFPSKAAKEAAIYDLRAGGAIMHPQCMYLLYTGFYGVNVSVSLYQPLSSD